MNRDTAKLLGISRDLSHLGLELSNREVPFDEEVTVKIGEAMVALSEAIADISGALERGARNNAAAANRLENVGLPAVDGDSLSN